MKILKSKKALSPVVASIILIAVTVAVSIAVAAWMGALSFSFMGSGEQLNVGSPYGWANGTDTVKINVACPGGSAVTIQYVRINGTQYDNTKFTVNPTGAIQPTSTAIVTVSSVSPTFISGYYYTIVIVTGKNHEFQTTGMVP
jgi:flagellin-like protein